MMSDEEFSDRKAPIRENMALQRRTWRFERVGWLALIMLVALALGGLFSKGPLSQVTRSSADGRLQVEYQRFSRNGAQESLIVTSHGAPGEMRWLVLGSGLLKGYSIEFQTPEPGPSRSQGQDLLIPMQGDEQGVATLYLTLRSDGVGLYRGSLGLRGQPALSLSKFIYP